VNEEAILPAIEAAEPGMARADAAATGEGREGPRRRDRRRRGHRGGEGRGERGPQPQRNAPSQPQAESSSAAEHRAEPPAATPASAVEPPSGTESTPVTERHVAPRADAAEIGAAPRETRVATPAAHPTALPEPTHPPAAPHRPIPELPPVSLALPPESGLELVETRAKAAPQTEEDQQPAGPRRVRPPKVQVADEPLQMVETAPKEPPSPAP
jgi:ribonuclease E